MWSERRSTRTWEIPGRRRGRRWSLVGIPILVALLAGAPARGEEARQGSLVTEVIGPQETPPGGTVMFRIDVRGATPGVTITVYEQLGSNLTYVGGRQDCVISALPVENLPGADPGAPGENRMACMLLTDDQGYASLMLETRVSDKPTRGPDVTTRSVAAIEDIATIGVGPVASAGVKLVGDSQ
jgi:hypothetical protein